MTAATLDPLRSLRQANNTTEERLVGLIIIIILYPAARRRSAALGIQQRLGLWPVGPPRRDPDHRRDPAADGPPLDLSARPLTANFQAALASIGTRLAISCRLRVARGAVDHALLDALDDPGETEEVVGEIPVELRLRPARRIALSSARRLRPASECPAPAGRARRAPRRRRRASSIASRDRRNPRADRRASQAPNRAPP